MGFPLSGLNLRESELGKDTPAHTHTHPSALLYHGATSTLKPHPKWPHVRQMSHTEARGYEKAIPDRPPL